MEKKYKTLVFRLFYLLTYKKDKYIIIDHKRDYIYTPELDMFFPRMYSSSPQHIEAYKEWTNFKGKPVKVKNYQGETHTVYKPTFGENLKL